MGIQRRRHQKGKNKSERKKKKIKEKQRTYQKRIFHLESKPSP